MRPLDDAPGPDELLPDLLAGTRDRTDRAEVTDALDAIDGALRNNIRPLTGAAAMKDVVVIDFPTIMDGHVVRWYADEHAANHHDPIISASREAVQIHEPGPLATELLPQAEQVGRQVYVYYREGGRGEKTWAPILTHRARLFGDVELIQPKDRA
jgi:hypothetical protein